MTHDAAQVDLFELIDLFYKQPAAVGKFEEISAKGIPPATRSLLDHEKHMTVTVERYYGSAVAVKVLQARLLQNWYAREILLERTSTSDSSAPNIVVQYGIVQLNLELLEAAVRSEVLAGQKPLGRVLVDHQVLRTVELLSLQRILPGPVLQHHLGLRPEQVCFGRTAVIHCAKQPAIRLLEIVPDIG